MPRIDLNVSSGQDITNEVNSNFQSGNEVHIPAGTYDMDLGALEGDYSNASLIGDGDVQINHSWGGGRINIGAGSGEVRIENITIRGQMTFSKGGFKIANGGATLVFKNFNLPDGQPDGPNIIPFYIGDGSTGGTTVFENCHIEHFFNNGIYSADDTSGNHNLVVRGCYLRNINSDFVRVGDDGDLVEGNVFIHDGRKPTAGSRGTFQTGRCIRQVQPGSVTIRNNDFILTSAATSPAFQSDNDNSSGGTVTLRDNRVKNDSSDPAFVEVGNLNIRGGGNSLTGSNTSVDSAFDHVISCRGSGCPEPTRSAPGGSGGVNLDNATMNISAAGADAIYEFTVTGDLTGHGLNDPPDRKSDVISGSSAEGEVVAGFSGDKYTFTGEVKKFNADNPVSLSINGKNVPQPMPNHLRIVPKGNEAHYEATITGQATEDSVNSDDGGVNGQKISGQVMGDYSGDAFWYGGVIDSWTWIQGEADVYVNGMKFDTSSLNEGPTAAWTWRREGNQTIFFDGRDSHDPDGSITKYRWNIGGNTYESPTVQHTFPAPGNYDVVLHVMDDGGSQSKLKRNITVKEDNKAPVARFDTSVTDLEATFDASSSSDPDGAIQSYNWEVAGSTYRGVKVQHTFASAGTYTVHLTVKDGDGKTATETTNVTVSRPNLRPESAFNYTTDGLTVDLDAKGSSDPDGTLTSYQWDIGGQGAVGPQVQHTFSSAGSYTVSLTVTDDAGSKHTTTKDITVSKKPPKDDGGDNEISPVVTGGLLWWILRGL